MWAGCNGLSGDCCPNHKGEMLACCDQTPVPTPTARPKWGGITTISKVGFPEKSIDGRPSCGSYEVKKSFRNPRYILPILFQGYRERSCPARGFRRYEREDTKGVRRFPFIRKYNQSFDVWSHEPSWMDTSLCVAAKCLQPVRNVLGDSFVHGLGSALGSLAPCMAGTWECLGETKCSEAAKCLAPVVQTCGNEALELLTERTSRATLACIWDCNMDDKCVLSKCGADAIKCLTDKGCRQRVFCFPRAMLSCSKPALDCLLDKSGLCRTNLKCFAEATPKIVASLGDFAADTNLEGVFSCAKEHCPKPSGPALPHDSTMPSGGSTDSAEAPEPVTSVEAVSTHECIHQQCQAEVDQWHKTDTDYLAASKCPETIMNECGSPVFDCLFGRGGKQQCYADAKCLADGLLGLPGQPSSGWLGATMEQLTDSKARAFDEEVYTCFSTCSEKRRSKFGKLFCYFMSCRKEVKKCLGDGLCREAFLGVGEVLERCGKQIVGDYRTSWQAHLAGECLLKVADECGNDLVEMVRDTNTSAVIECAHRKCHQLVPQDVIVV